MEEKRLGARGLLLVGLTLFSLFFGAGNLIFPSGIGAMAGVHTWPAVAGLAVSAVGLPVLGVVAVSRAGGMDALAGRVHPVFARAFTVAVYLAIGPCLAIPRTATTSFEMAVPPFVGEGAPVALLRLIYSLVFFAAALALALRPEKLTDRLGKILCPVLVGLIVVTFAASMLNPLEGYGPAGGEYLTHPAVRGFLEGYQTMDTLAALAFGIVIAVNLRARGVEKPGAVVRSTAWAGVIAGVLLLAVYCMLAHVGALSGGAMPNPADGAEALTNAAGLLFGTGGRVLLAAIFLIACFNVCVGLISSCGTYFHGICPRLGYRTWAVLFAVVSMVISNAGLAQILAVLAGGAPVGLSRGGAVHGGVQRAVRPAGCGAAPGLPGRTAPGRGGAGMGAPGPGRHGAGAAVLRAEEMRKQGAVPVGTAPSDCRKTSREGEPRRVPSSADDGIK